MFLRGSLAPHVLALLLLFVVSACGSRSGLDPGVEVEEPPQCISDTDCDRSNLCALQGCVEGSCQVTSQVECPPATTCEVATCLPASGLCESAPLTMDTDGDGFRAPLAGYAPGEAGACGDDCDDTRPQSFPGNFEYCDGTDNDCDGVVDNGSEFLSGSSARTPERAVSSLSSTGASGIAAGNGVFAFGYWGQAQEMTSYLQGWDSDGNTAFAETQIANVNAPSSGADLAWSGDSFGAVWSDLRFDQNYEVFFARFDAAGSKRGPDLRVTTAPDFSIDPSVIFDQGRFVVLWDDRRNGADGAEGLVRVFAQILDSEGNALTENLVLTTETEIAEAPEFAASPARFGLVYTSLQFDRVALSFRSFDKAFGDPTPTIVLSDENARNPRATAVGDLFVVTWEVYAAAPGPSIMGAVLSDRGELVVGPQPLTAGARFARSHDVVSLGDRLVLLWADDLDGNYELYATVLSVGFDVVEPRTRLTYDDADTLAPQAAMGEYGTLGVLFDDWRSGQHQAYFLSLGCKTARPTQDRSSGEE